MDLKELKEQIQALVDQDAERLHSMAREIYDHPELGNEEYRASALLVDALKEAGFIIEKPYLDVETGFKATLDTGKPGGTIALMTEYDALPGIGHGCGHNLIGVMSIGAARALAKLKEQLSGRIIVFGCPAEETNGAKVVFARGGAFDDVDAAMQVHPGSRNAVGGSSLAIEPLEFIFTGRTAHAAGNPEDGINALDAAIQMFNGVNALRQHVKSTTRIHGIIKEGGLAANVVPERAVTQFYVRAPKRDYLDTVVAKVKAIAEAGAQMAGASLEIINFEYPNDDMRSNEVLADLWVKQMVQLGVPEAEIERPKEGGGSSDVGNVSHKTATIQPSVSITGGVKVSGHSREFAACTITEEGRKATLLSAKGLAFCVAELLCDEKLRQQAKDEFAKKEEN